MKNRLYQDWLSHTEGKSGDELCDTIEEFIQNLSRSEMLFIMSDYFKDIKEEPDNLDITDL